MNKIYIMHIYKYYKYHTIFTCKLNKKKNQYVSMIISYLSRGFIVVKLYLQLKKK